MIGEEVFIGIDAIILPGVAIGDRCVVGAGSVVTADVPSGSVVAGYPARRISGTAELEAKIAAQCSSDADLASEKDFRHRVRLAIRIEQQKRSR